MTTIFRVPRLVTLLFAGLLSAVLVRSQATNINVGTTLLQSPLKRLGINLGQQTSYDSGQMVKNLLFTNPGFEGEIYNSTIRCNTGTANTCVDENAFSAWPSGFWNGATFQVFYGSAQGRTGTI